MKIYTRKGDTGETALLDGRRVPKHHPRVAAYGGIDELNAFVGWAMSAITDPETVDLLGGIQRDLFALGAQLADPGGKSLKTKQGKVLIGEERIAEFERKIDEYEKTTGPVRVFILPAGSPGAVAAHILRTVCRRAERAVTALSEKEPVPPMAIPYLNRLSDLFFAMARFLNARAGVADMPWE